MTLHAEEKTAYRVAENIFLVIYFAVITLLILGQSCVSQPDWLADTINILMIVALVITIFRFIVAGRDKSELIKSIVCVIFAAILAISYLFCGDILLLYTAGLMLCAKDIDFRKLLCCGSVALLMGTVTVILAAVTGVIGSEITITDSGVIVSVGFASVRYYAAALFYLILSILAMIPWPDKMKKPVLFICIALTIAYSIYKFNLYLADGIGFESIPWAALITLSVCYAAGFMWLTKNGRPMLAQIMLLAGLASMVGGTYTELPFNIFLPLAFSGNSDWTIIPIPFAPIIDGNLEIYDLDRESEVLGESYDDQDDYEDYEEGAGDYEDELIEGAGDYEDELLELDGEEPDEEESDSKETRDNRFDTAAMAEFIDIDEINRLTDEEQRLTEQKNAKQYGTKQDSIKQKNAKYDSVKQNDNNQAAEKQNRSALPMILAAVLALIGIEIYFIVFANNLNLVRTANDILNLKRGISGDEWPEIGRTALLALALFLLVGGLSVLGFTLGNRAISRTGRKVSRRKAGTNNAATEDQLGSVVTIMLPATAVIASVVMLFVTYYGYGNVFANDNTDIQGNIAMCEDALYLIEDYDGTVYTDQYGEEHTADIGEFYTDEAPYYFGEKLGKVHAILFTAEQLAASKKPVTIITGRENDCEKLIRAGFYYTPISDIYAVYTNDEGAVNALNENQYICRRSYSEWTEVDLTDIAARRSETIDETGAMIVGDGASTFARTIGPYIDLEEGIYEVEFDVQLLSSFEDTNTQVGTLFFASDDSKYKHDIQPVYAYDFADGESVTFTLTGDLQWDTDRVEFNVEYANDAVMRITSIRYRMIQYGHPESESE